MIIRYPWSIHHSVCPLGSILRRPLLQLSSPPYPRLSRRTYHPMAKPAPEKPASGERLPPLHGEEFRIFNHMADKMHALVSLPFSYPSTVTLGQLY